MSKMRRCSLTLPKFFCLCIASDSFSLVYPSFLIEGPQVLQKQTFDYRPCVDALALLAVSRCPFITLLRDCLFQGVLTFNSKIFHPYPDALCKRRTHCPDSVLLALSSNITSCEDAKLLSRFAFHIRHFHALEVLVSRYPRVQVVPASFMLLCLCSPGSSIDKCLHPPKSVVFAASFLALACCETRNLMPGIVTCSISDAGFPFLYT